MMDTTKPRPQVGDDLLSLDPLLVGRAARHMEESVVASLVQSLTREQEQKEGVGWSPGQLAVVLQGMEVAKSSELKQIYSNKTSI